MDKSLLIVIVIFTIAVIFMLLHNRKIKKERDEANAKADIAAAEAWKTDYHNPESPTYDPVRCQQEIDEFKNSL